MKNILLFILISCTIASCTKKPGNLTGNIYWKYNNYVGNKPDSGAKITLYALDKKQKDSIFETTADMSGNYSINDIPPARYLLLVQSANTTASPKDHIDNLQIYSDDLKHVFGFDIEKYAGELSEINEAYKKHEELLSDFDDKKYGGLSQRIQLYEKYEQIANDKSVELIKKLPNNLRLKLGLYAGFNKSIYLKNIDIKEEKTTTENTDFGITYM